MRLTDAVSKTDVPDISVVELISKRDVIDHSVTNCDGNKDELHYCFSCGCGIEVNRNG